MVIPKEVAVKFTKRAMNVLETENRLRKEIKEGLPLSKVAELLKWKKSNFPTVKIVSYPYLENKK